MSMSSIFGLEAQMEMLSTAPRNAHVHLPVEILQTIFSLAVDRKFTIPEGLTSDQRVHIAYTCSYWRSVALQTPQLWDDIVIDIDTRRAHEVFTIAAAILSRNPSSPKSVTVRRKVYGQRAPKRPTANEFIDQLIFPFSNSIKKLRLIVPFQYIISLLSPRKLIEFPILESLSTSQASHGVLTESHLTALGTHSNLKLPRLAAVETSMFLGRMEIADAFLNTVQSSQLTTLAITHPLRVDVFFHILSNCTHLKACGIYLERIENLQIELDPLPVLVMPHLERFHIRYSSIRGFQSFLSKFILPSIRDLALKSRVDGLGWTQKLSELLLNQCGPSLEHLYVASSAMSHELFSLEGLDKVLDKYRFTLKRLYIPLTRPSRGTLRLHSSEVRRLVSRDWCPNLRSLSLEYYWSTPERMAAVMDGVLEAEAYGRKPVEELCLGVGYHVREVIVGDVTVSALKSKFNVFSVCYYGDFTNFDSAALEESWFGYCC